MGSAQNCYNSLRTVSIYELLPEEMHKLRAAMGLQLPLKDGHGPMLLLQCFGFA